MAETRLKQLGAQTRSVMTRLVSHVVVADGAKACDIPKLKEYFDANGSILGFPAAETVTGDARAVLVPDGGIARAARTGRRGGGRGVRGWEGSRKGPLLEGWRGSG